MTTSLQGIAKKAVSDRKHRFQNLYGMLNETHIAGCWLALNKKAAAGVDGVSALEYGQHLAGNVRDLVKRLKEKRYRAPMVRRHYIPKGQGRTRPLGIPATEDKLLQMAVAKILEAIWEQEFLPCSFGYRPRIGAREAVNR
jgi:RNA-directed DNA polymerase